jgi:dTDP-4-amino-4,6-dideoxygalactose transaminase
MKSIPVLTPHAPDLDGVTTLLREAHANKRYTNHGPLESRLRTQMAFYFGRRDPDNAALLSSGTVALTACLRAFNLPEGSRCLVPSWTFVGTVCAIVQAGLEPVFIDVEADSWTPSIEMLDAGRKQSGAAAAVVIAPFGAAVDYDGLARYAAETGLRILVDAAAAFDFVERLAAASTAFTLPIMVSLHATKLASSLEGGLVLWDDPQAVRRIVAWSNFGIYNQDPIVDIGCNAKLSEVHAAYGLGSLAIWPGVRDRMVEIADRYVRLFADRNANVGFAPNIRSRLATSTFNVTVPGLRSDAHVVLVSKGIETRKWWRDGVHTLPAYENVRMAAPLETTTRLARTTVGIPFYHDLNQDDQAFIVECVCELSGR